MRITAAGNVGIGRSNPGTFGNLEVGGTAYSAISVNSSSGSGSVLILAANGTTETRINTNTNHPMVFYTNNTSRMTLTAAGSLVMNTASAVIAGDFSNATIDNRNAFMSATNNGDTYIDIIPNGTGTISSVSCHNNNIRANASYTAITTSSTDSLLVAGRSGVGTYLPLSIYVAGSQSAAFNTDGTVQLNSNIGVTASAANVFVDIADNYKLKRSTSSLRYKDNIATYTKGLAEVLLLRAVTFTDKNDHTKPAAGFIAEEVDAAGFTEFVVYDTDGLPDSLNYANMTSLLAKAIQELASMVTDLQTRVTALEGA
jgi:hypothetical protein